MPANDSFFRSQNKLHVVFAISCVAMLVSVVWMMAADQADEWRGYQRTNFRLDVAVKEQALKDIQNQKFEDEKSRLETRRNELNTALKEYSDLQAEFQASTDLVRRKIERLEFELKSQNADRDEARANYDLAIRDQLPESDASVLLHVFDEKQGTADQIQLDLDDAKAELDAIGKPTPQDDNERRSRLQEYAKLTKEQTDVQAALDRLEADKKLVEASLQNLNPDSLFSKIKRQVMQWPIIDGFNSPTKVQQDWLPNLSQTLGMTSIARFDRCRTCHLNIDKTGPGNVAAFPSGHPKTDDVHDWVTTNVFPEPFATHPKHSLYATAASPHSVAKFGCTICHDGQGSGTSFGNAEHTPNDPHIAEEWEHDYHWHANHFWEYPMQPDRFIESTCIKCHHDVTELGIHPKFGASAPKVYRGYQLIRKYGCFGCHEIHGFDAGKAIGPDMRLEPQTDDERDRIADDPTQNAGKFRKVGPSLRHLASKTSSDFVSYWTEIPGRYRPTTKMPQFFNLSNQEDETAQRYEAVELAGLAQFLIGNSEELDLLSPAADYKPDAERGRALFTERGCLACHQHSAVPGVTADFGPNISDIHRKVNRNADDPSFSDWLYTWVRDPVRHHPRTRMPNLYLNVYTDADGNSVDPAADIVAFLLSAGSQESFPTEQYSDESLDELVTLFLKKSRFSDEAAREIVRTGAFPQPAKDVAGDEKVLATEDGSSITDPQLWKQKKLEYIGRRTVTRYGCYGCHDIPGFETARPIGVALQDWGRKDTSRLGLEHIEEFLHHHGEPDGSSTAERIKNAMAMAEDGTRKPGDPEYDSELTAAFFYESLLHHGRPGFLWQKLRDPRSYDYMKTETKGYDERLRMPRFPLQQDEIESIATFVLGLVAEPPATAYVYHPTEREKARIDGEFLLAKYNCTGCHMVELPKVTYGVNVEDDVFATELTPQDHEKAVDLLLQFRKPTQALTGQSRVFKIDGEDVSLPLASFHGLKMVPADPDEEDPEFRETGFDTWETLDFGTGDDAKRILPSSRITISDSKLASYVEGRGGDFAEWLVEELTETRTGGNRNLAWQSSPPPLYQEGLKVQTPWLYQWLQEPDQLRYTTVLRMPRFNLSSEDAQTLANYFAAVDGATFPYQEQETTDADYLASREHALQHEGLLKPDQDYLQESWLALNGPLCIKCHSVGGRKFKVSNPKEDIQGPNLIRVHQRLRSDWVKLWLYKPTWITPYTSMPVNYPHNNRTQFPDLFTGDPDAQIIATRDALMNYGRMLENIGPVVYAPPGAEPPADAAGAAESADEATSEETKEPAAGAGG
ncbi:MAG: hypothetical protein R3C19_21300 [Planctomycetaceae bacterium]